MKNQKKNEEPLHLSFEMLDDEEVQNLRLLSGNRNDQSSYDPNDDIVNNNLVFSSKGKNTSSGQHYKQHTHVQQRISDVWVSENNKYTNCE